MNNVQGCEHMRAVEISGPGVLALVDRPDPLVGDDDLLVEPLVVGVCATDRELLDGSMVYLRQGMTQLPLVPGHEWVGRVTEVGRRVTSFVPGDLVVGECSIGCGRCVLCWEGNYHRCAQRFETGVLNFNGALATRMLFPSRAAHKVPEGVSLDDAAMIEPLAVSLRAVDRLEVSKESTVLIVGAGIIGLLCMMLLQSLQNVTAVVLEVSDARRERVKSLGGTAVSHIGTKFDRVIEASGSESGIRAALDAVQAGGRAVLIGLSGQNSVPINSDAIVVGDQTILGSLGSPNVWPRALQLLADGLIEPKRLISHKFPLHRSEEAFHTASQNLGDVGKVVVIPSGDSHE